MDFSIPPWHVNFQVVQSLFSYLNTRFVFDLVFLRKQHKMKEYNDSIVEVNAESK